MLEKKFISLFGEMGDVYYDPQNDAIYETGLVLQFTDKKTGEAVIASSVILKGMPSFKEECLYFGDIGKNWVKIG